MNIFQRLRLQATRYILRGKSDIEWVVSMTSHAPRFRFLEEFFATFQQQTLLPSVLLLWISKSERHNFLTLKLQLPSYVNVRFCEELGPGKKLIPTLRIFPNSKIITLDDDVHYPNDLIENMILYANSHPKRIIAGRVHRITKDYRGNTKNYEEWDFDFEGHESLAQNLFPTGVGAVLYPPKSLHPDVLNVREYRKTALFQDDVWFYAQASRAGTEIWRIPGTREIRYLSESQEMGLYETVNKFGENNSAIARMRDLYKDLEL